MLHKEALRGTKTACVRVYVSVHDHMSVGRAPDLGRDGVSGTSYNDG